MKRTLVVLTCMLLSGCAAWAQAAEETITIPRSEFDALKAQVDQMQQEIRELKADRSPAQPAEQPRPSESPGETAQPTTAPSTGGKYLLLPDISLIVQSKGKLTDDKQDPSGQKIELTEAEIGIQGYVYPNVKADAFITMSPSEGASAQVEEAYLTYLGLTKGLNLYVGQKHVPFGRTNLLHNHSWLYVRQPLAFSNLVAGESLTGQGADVSYLIPTHSDLFAQLDVGAWANGDPAEGASNLPSEGDLGANMSDRFTTARLWAGHPAGENGEVEAGGSYADGQTIQDPATLQTNNVQLTGVDLSYRHFGEANKRLLLRGESFWRRGSIDSNGNSATGYYVFGNYRWDKYGSIGLLYDWSEFPRATGLHESALSLILTKQFSEQYYLRLQGTHGSRPDADPYNELWLQWVWGVGPHTHNLE